MKLLSIIGARPQFIKYSAISRAISLLQKQGMPIEEVLVDTGQHYDYLMAKIFFDELLIPTPQYNLGVGSGSHGAQTAEILRKSEEILQQEKPDWVIIFGDTNSTLAAALAASKLHLPLVHIEAGLRSYNRYMPEEINRIVADSVSNILFCPSEVAVKNLRQEGYEQILHEGKPLDKTLISQKKQKIDKNTRLVANLGDVMYDTLLFAASLAKEKSTIRKQLHLQKEQAYVLLTIHRAENTSLDEILALFAFIEKTAEGKKIIFPVHPRTQKLLQENAIPLPSTLQMIEPLGYYDLLEILQYASFVMTDSGGLQKEAYWLKVPCITLRPQTEWVETVETNWNILQKDFTPAFFTQTRSNEQAYGQGNSAENIIRFLASF